MVWDSIGTFVMLTNARGERPPQTGTVERTGHSRIAAQLGTERRGGGSAPPTCWALSFRRPLINARHNLGERGLVRDGLKPPVLARALQCLSDMLRPRVGGGRAPPPTHSHRDAAA